MSAERLDDTTSRGRVAVHVTPPSAWDKASLGGLLDVIREDVAVNGSPFTPGTQMLIHYRFGQWLDHPRRRFVTVAIGNVLYRLFYLYVRNVIGFEVPRTAALGRRIKFVHQHGVTVHTQAQIGDECLVRHNVTIGLRWDPTRPGPHDPPPPRIGRNVQFGVGTTIIGGVCVGDDAVLGALALVARNVPSGASVVAAPSRTLRLRGEDA